ncbi:TPA: restriction endonuclease subunit S [Streptococcus suis]
MTRMKDSGIEWIGEVPEDWGIKPIKHIFGAIGSGTTPDSSKVEYYDGNINWLQSGDLYKKDYVYVVSKTITDLGYRSSASLRIYQAPFLAIAMYGASIGNLAIIKIDACVNQAVAVLKGEENIVRFAKLALEISKTELIFAAQGGTQPNINQVLIKNWVIPFPSEIEIKKIADFLDKKVAQLDKVKSLLEEQIKTLEDYRQSLIYETVTKGLDKTVPLKDSGVDWIGQIPEGWGIGRLKHFYNLFAGGDIQEENFSVEFDDKFCYPVLSNSKENNGIFGYSNVYRFEEGTVTVTGRGDIGYAEYRTFKYFPIIRLLVCVPFIKTDGRFTTYWINSAVIEKNQTAVSQLTRFTLGELPFPKIDLEVQREIAAFLDKKTEQINQMIAIKKEQIENINKQRQTLIYDYVTGKRRV